MLHRLKDSSAKVAFVRTACLDQIVHVCSLHLYWANFENQNNFEGGVVVVGGGGGGGAVGAVEMTLIQLYLTVVSISGVEFQSQS